MQGSVSVDDCIGSEGGAVWVGEKGSYVIVGFHSRDQQPCFSTKTKENVCIRIE